MNKQEKQDRFEKLEKKAIDNFVEVQMDLIGFKWIIADHLDDDEQKEYYQLEKELHS